MDTLSGSERPVVTYLKTPGVTPLARVRRIFFDKTSIILIESKINVHERLRYDTSMWARYENPMDGQFVRFGLLAKLSAIPFSCFSLFR